MANHKLYVGDALEVLKTLPDESVDCVITSPPYWGLRDYGEETNKVWDGNSDCEHKFEVIETKRANASGGKTDYAKQKLAIKGTENYSEFVDYHNRITKSSFCKKCGAWYGQLGLEPTLDLYLKHMLQITAELKRVLKKTGVMFWNHGDCYGGTGTGHKPEHYPEGHKLRFKGTTPSSWYADLQKVGVKPKCMALQNYRLVLRMIDEQGWILRNVIIWHKPNHMPSSVKDRFTNAYEPVFMLVKSKKYWFDLDAVRIPHKESSIKRWESEIKSGRVYSFNYRIREAKKRQYEVRTKSQCGIGSVNSNGNTNLAKQPHPLGKNPGGVWKPYAVQKRVKEWIEYRNLPQIDKIKNYLNEWRKKKGLTIKEIEELFGNQAPHHWFNGESYPSKENWIKLKEILGFDDRYDEQMTKTFFKLSEKQNHPLGKNPGDLWTIPTQPFSEAHFAVYPEKLVEPMIKAGCPKTGIVLDPFAGSGTTMIVAEKLGRNSIGIELNPKYVELIKKRFEPYLKQAKLIGETKLEIVLPDHIKAVGNDTTK